MASLPTAATDSLIAATSRRQVIAACAYGGPLGGSGLSSFRSLPRTPVLVAFAYLTVAYGTTRWFEGWESVEGAAMAAAGSAAFFQYLRGSLRLSLLSALIGGLWWALHPVSRSLWMFESLSRAELFPLVVPLAVLSLANQARVSGRIGLLVVGMLGGLALGGDPIAAIPPLGLIMVCMIIESFASEPNLGTTRRLRIWALMLCGIIAIGVASHFAGSFFGWSGESDHSQASPRLSSIPSPLLHWIDPQGFIEARLPATTASERGWDGSQYMGCSLILLALVGVIKSRRFDGLVTRRVAAMGVVGFACLWLTLPDESLHTQTVLLFRESTVRRYVDPISLHLVGLAILIAFTLPTALGVSLVRLIRASRPMSLPAILAGTGAAWAWWYFAPSDLFTATVQLHSNLAMHAATSVFALGLIVAASVGLQRLLDCERILRKLVVSFVVITVTALDLLGLPPNGASDSSNNVSTSPVEGRLHTPVVKEGERAQVVFTEVNRLPDRLAAQLPLSFYRRPELPRSTVCCDPDQKKLQFI